MSTKVTDIQARIGAEIGGFEKNLKSAEASANVFARELAKMEQAERHMASFEAQAYREATQRDKARIASQQQVGRAFIASGAAIALGIGYAVKAAVDWQAAFAGMQKVLPSDTSATVFGALDRQLRDLANTLPVSAEEIAGLATSAAQLGVPTQNLIQFTRAAVDLGQTTTLSAEDAVTGLAKLGNVMEPGKFSGNIDRAGSALLALGNAGASTEAEILDMAQRISGAGKTIGLTEPQVLAFANALSSVGIDAEAGGTAISRVMIDMAVAVKDGGGALDNFARVSGQTSQQFATQFRTDAAGAIQSFIGGLGQIKKSGGDVFSTLDNLNLSEIRVRDTLLRSSEASGLLTDSLALGSKAWEESSALSDAASKRYETAGAKVAIARNNLNDAAITIGGTFLPAVAAAADKTAALTAVFEDLPGPTKSTLASIGGIAAVALTLGGTALILVPKLHSLVTALDEMGPRGARAAGGLRTMGSALAGPVGIALAVGTVALGAWMAKQAEAKQRVQELTRAIKEDGQAIGQHAKQLVIDQLGQEGALEAARKLGLNLADVTAAALGDAAAQQRVTAALADQKAAVDAATGGVGNLSGAHVQGKTAATEFANRSQIVTNAIGTQSDALASATQKAKDEAAALETTSSGADNAAGSMSRTAREAVKVATGADAAATALQEFDKAIHAIFTTQLGVEAANDKFTKSLNDVAQAAEDARGGGKTKVTADQRSDAKRAGDEAKAQALAAGKSRAQAIAEGKVARASVLAEHRTVKQTAVEASNAQIGLRDAMRSVVQEGLDVLSAMKETGASTEEIKAKAQELSTRIYNQARAYGVPEKAAKHYAQVLEDVPDVTTAVVLNGTEEALAKLGEFERRVAIINGTPAIIQISSSAANVREDRGVSQANLDAAYRKQTPVTPSPRGKSKSFASGGIEDHSAQVGYRRVWAEPETGGEAYIPLSQAKRGRSVALLQNVAQRFGMNVSRGAAATSVHVVRVPVAESHSVTHPVNLNGPITVVANSPNQFTDWSQTQGRFGTGGVG